MPAFTVNRGYPYSVPGDPADVPQALQDLAEAVDTDLAALEALVGPRPMARVRGTTPVSVIGAGLTSAQLNMELIDFNVGGAIAPLTNGTVQVLLPGVWFAFATVTCPAPVPAASIDYLGFSIIEPGNNEIGYMSTHVPAPLAELQRNYDAGGAAFLDPSFPGGDTLFVRGSVNRSAGSAEYRFADRSLTLIRMTES